MMVKRIKYAFAAFFAFAILACNNSGQQKADTKDENTSLAQAETTDQEEAAAPAIHAEFKDENGKTIHTKDLAGKVVFINFWATWCPPCLKEMPSIQVLYDEFKDNGDIEFLIVEIENDIDGAKKFLTDQKLSLPIVYPSGEIPRSWLGGAIPTTIILDKNGKTAAKQEGMYDFASQAVTDFIQELINQ
ncbi:MAG TPA: TlpA disulfide reductase family protein [Sphingobacterium sp.]|nr:TlpA disulfide reductase family protein [Sphingobacterium sp.]